MKMDSRLSPFHYKLGSKQVESFNIIIKACVFTDTKACNFSDISFKNQYLVYYVQLLANTRDLKEVFTSSIKNR